MAKYLVIVESPAKAKTIEKFLGKNYKVLASIGHIRDLPKSKMGVDVEDNFEPKYINIRGKGPLIKELKKEAKKAEKIFLATDPDREGEAIAFHLAYILGLDINDNIRVTFNAITKKTVKESIKNPTKINMNLVDAQQARRVLDRLVGYSISPILWRKVKKGLSAGRVQSVATKLICDREKEINAFKNEEYWVIDFIFDNGLESVYYGPSKLKTQSETEKVIEELKKGEYVISSVLRKNKKRNPNNAFTTSRLQQEAANKLGFSTKKTMMVAQQLYEGIKLPKIGSVGLITYMRTDSTRLSKEAVESVQEFILTNYGKEYLGEYTNKASKNAQDAHEAIRATDVLRTPDSIKDYLTTDQNKLYKLIWERYVSSLMAAARFDSLTVDIKNNQHIIKSTGSTLEFDGFLKVYSFGVYKENTLSDVKEKEVLTIEKIVYKQNFTSPPPRYTEASLVKEMEEKGIGRPSTYAPTISTVINRGYIGKEKKSLYPTELGVLVDTLIEDYFCDIIKVDFTANMEKEFDYVSEGKIQWKNVIKEFYGPFTVLLSKAESDIEKVDLTEETDIKCEKCGSMMMIKHGRYGKFLACSNYPECENTKPILNKIGVKCPVCKNGDIIERKTKKFKTFYGCSEFPDCNFVSWYKPVSKECPKCGDMLIEYNTKKKHEIKCINKDCDYNEQIIVEEGKDAKQPIRENKKIELDFTK